MGWLTARGTQHLHDYFWRWSPEGAVWYGEWGCGCGHVAFALTARDRADLNETLALAFRDDRLSAVAYFASPVDIPFSPGIFEW